MMTFDEYEVMHERCELYKRNAIKSILQVVSPTCDPENAVSEGTHFYSIRDGMLNYLIIFRDGKKLFGVMYKSTFQLAMEGKIEEARVNYGAEED
jgi:hypothetical protein